MMNGKSTTSHFPSQENEPAQSNCPAQTAGHSESPFATLNPKFSPDNQNPCPVCQQMSLETAFQPPLVKGKGTGYTLCHCKNPNCQQYGVTLNAEQYQTMAALEHLAAQLAAALAQMGNE